MNLNYSPRAAEIIVNQLINSHVSDYILKEKEGDLLIATGFAMMSNIFDAVRILMKPKTDQANTEHVMTKTEELKKILSDECITDINQQNSIIAAYERTISIMLSKKNH